MRSPDFERAFQLLVRVRYHSRLVRRSYRSSNCKLASPGRSESPLDIRTLRRRARNPRHERKSDRSPSMDDRAESLRTGTKSNVHRVAPIANNAGTEMRWANPQSPSRDPGRQPLPLAALFRRFRQEEEQCGILKFSRAKAGALFRIAHRRNSGSEFLVLSARRADRTPQRGIPTSDDTRDGLPSRLRKLRDRWHKLFHRRSTLLQRSRDHPLDRQLSPKEKPNRSSELAALI